MQNIGKVELAIMIIFVATFAAGTAGWLWSLINH